MSSLDTNLTMQTQELKLKEQLKIQTKAMGARSLSSATNFAIIGSIFAGSECIMQGVSVKND